MTQKKILFVGFEFTIDGSTSCNWGEPINPVDFDICFFNVEALDTNALYTLTENYLSDLKRMIQECQVRNELEIYCIYHEPVSIDTQFNHTKRESEIPDNFSWLPVVPEFRKVPPFTNVVLEGAGTKLKQFYDSFSLEHNVNIFSNTGFPALSDRGSFEKDHILTDIGIINPYIESKTHRKICFDVDWDISSYNRYNDRIRILQRPTYPIHFIPYTSKIEEIVKFLLSEITETKRPDWIDGIGVTEEKKLLIEIAQIDVEIHERTNRKSELTEGVRKFQKPKSVLFETGKPLEKAVSSVFEELELPLMKPKNSAVEDRYFDIENVKIYVEVRGKEKESFLEKDLNQLIQRIADQVTHPTYPLRGIFVFNHQRLQDPSIRTNPFEQNIAKKAEAFGICLLDTVTLFELYKSKKEGAEFSFLELLKNTTGIFKREV